MPLSFEAADLAALHRRFADGSSLLGLKFMLHVAASLGADRADRLAEDAFDPVTRRWVAAYGGYRFGYRIAKGPGKPGATLWKPIAPKPFLPERVLARCRAWAVREIAAGAAAGDAPVELIRGWSWLLRDTPSEISGPETEMLGAVIRSGGVSSETKIALLDAFGLNAHGATMYGSAPPDVGTAAPAAEGISGIRPRTPEVDALLSAAYDDAATDPKTRKRIGQILRKTREVRGEAMGCAVAVAVLGLLVAGILYWRSGTTAGLIALGSGLALAVLSYVIQRPRAAGPRRGASPEASGRG